MIRSIVRVVLPAVMFYTAGATISAQPQTTTDTKTFEVVAVEGNDLVVRLPEGTKELNVPEDFRFTVDGKQMSVHDLKPGMKGTAVVTTKTTMHPVTVTEVKNGTVMQASAASIIVKTDQGFKSFTQSDIDKRGIKILRDGQPAQISDFHSGDQLSATIVTTRPPRAVTEKQVQATLARSGAGTAAGTAGAAAGGTASAGTTSSGAANASRSAASGGTMSSRSTAGTSGGAAPSSGGRTLPKTASQMPLVGLIGVLCLCIAFALTLRRRRLAR
jgi:LPXTG-motif cell wall-anchored protein